MDLLGAGDPEQAEVAAVAPLDVHGTTLYDVTLRFEDGRREQHRLGAESVPEDLEAGERVAVQRVMAMVVGIRRLS